MSDGDQWSYTTRGGIEIHVDVAAIQPEAAIEDLVDRLDSARGVLLSSSYEYPGRYTRWDMGFVDPPLVVSSYGETVRFEALNARGEVLLNPVRKVAEELEFASIVQEGNGHLVCRIERGNLRFDEE